MAAFNTAINSFLSGELSPKVFGRAETDQFKQACEELTNMAVYPQGGAYRRPGTRYIDTIDQSLFYSSSTIRALPFIAANGKKFVVLAIPGLLNNWKIVDVQLGTYQAFVNSISAGYTFTTDQVKEMHFTQVGDLLFIAHGTMKPKVLRYDGTNIIIDDYEQGIPTTVDDEIFKRFPYTDIETNNINLNRGIIVASIAAPPGPPPPALVGTQVYLYNAAGNFRAGHVGALFRLSVGAVTGVAEVVYYHSDQVVIANQRKALPAVPYNYGSTVNDSWDEQAWSDARGWPRTVTSQDQRVYFGGTATQPSTVWGSAIGNVMRYMYRPLNDDPDFATYTNDNSRAFAITMAVDSSPIQWVSGGQSLKVGTVLREHVWASGQEAIGPVNVPNIISSTSYGSSYIQAVTKEGIVLFVPRNGQQVRDMWFNDGEQSYKSDDITLLCEHLPFKALEIRSAATSPVKLQQIAVQQNPNGIVFVVDNNGSLIGITVNRDAKIQAGHYHLFGGTVNVVGDAPKVHSICVLPSSLGAGADEVYLIIERRINGAQRLYLERMTDEYRGTDPHDATTPMVYVDSAVLKTSGSLTNTFSGLGHLEGKLVTVLGDGKDAGDVTVTGGSITLPATYNKVIVGLKYKSRLVTSNIETGSPIGSSQGLMKKVHAGIIRFFRTAAAKYGRKTQTQLDSLIFKPASTPSNAPIPLFTDDKYIHFPAAYDRKAQIAVETDRPLPMNITSITLRGLTYDN